MDVRLITRLLLINEPLNVNESHNVNDNLMTETTGTEMLMAIMVISWQSHSIDLQCETVHLQFNVSWGEFPTTSCLTYEQLPLRYYQFVPCISFLKFKRSFIFLFCQDLHLDFQPVIFVQFALFNVCQNQKQNIPNAHTTIKKQKARVP